MKHLWKIVLAVMNALGWIALPAEIRNTTEMLSTISLTQLMVVVNLTSAAAIAIWMFWRGEIQMPIIFGRTRLRKLEPLVTQLLLIKELNLSESGVAELTENSVVRELTEKLDRLRVPHPDLSVTCRPDWSRRELDRFFYVLAFLTGLRNLCASGDLKKAQSVHTSAMTAVASDD